MDNFVSLISTGSLTNAFNFLISASEGFNWYGFLIGAGMVICIILAYIMGTKRGYYKDLVFDIAIICIPLAIVGARLYYVIFDIIGGGNEWTFKEIIGLGQHGLSGLAIYGGLIGAVIGAVIIHFWKKKKPPQQKATFLQMCDLAFTVIILGQIIGRWGNFANQEAYGNLITNESFHWFPFAVFIENGVQGTGYYQATFFYESFLNCFGFALLMWIYNGKRKSFDGFSLSVYCIFYGLVRVFIEGLRTDSLYLFGNVRVSQVLSGILVLFGICFIVAHYYRARAKGLKPFVMVPIDKLDKTYYGYEQCILSNPNVYVKKEGGFFKRMFGKSEPEVTDIAQEDNAEDIVPDDLEDLSEINYDDEIELATEENEITDGEAITNDIIIDITNETADVKAMLNKNEDKQNEQ